MKRGYKVLRGRHSCIMYDARLDYQKGVMTRPHSANGPLCVFSRKADAKRFTANMDPDIGESEFTIVHCKYEPSQEMAAWHSCYRWTTSRSLAALPKGTRLADSVTCLE